MVIRRAVDSDRPAIIELCRASLGWRADDPNEQFFRWKHDRNAFGPSPAWVAEEDGRLLGLRVFLNWRFRAPDGSILRGVRAVDTATHPDAQGQGIFTRLTLGALPDLRESGVDFVYNTPNTKSRPGYLKMGWGEVGRVPVAVRVAGPASLRSVLGARAAAEKWSEPCDAGLHPSDAFASDDEVAALLDACDQTLGVATDRDAEYLRWRYAFEPLRYRVVPVGDAIREGVVVVRLRRRGEAMEATIADVLGAAPRAVAAAVRSILRSTGADFAIVGGGSSRLLSGFVPVPRLGPILTWKPVMRPGVPTMSELSLAMGDVELF